nr:MAG TPA: hypothetical protein [Caudoviricetes sp.]
MTLSRQTSKILNRYYIKQLKRVQKAARNK